ncbi:HTH DNA binding domain-containing protein [Halovenus aranensis]|uniref:HTH DNA binding domain-containing protein n=1 Tax=Halovenus aranensis TaxID=890420 RepID=A0A1G8UYM0_9EURY|nr:helix-turn-helix domain-containing protein [Halovenus aranensis]SDJ58952.1 HTH DNA binding domain-containing protein [Halovenus aranensis]
MRYLELSISRPTEDRHPMHEFVVAHDEYTVARQLYHRQYAPSEHALLFHVDGPVGSYTEAIQAVPSVIDFEIAPCSDDSFYIYVRDEVTDPGRALIDAFSQPGLLLARPLEYRADGTIWLAVIGPAEAIQSAADTVGETTETEVRTIGEFPSSSIDSRVGLTERQLEAVTAAVDCGYYEVPRAAGIEEVAARLACSTGTAGELLRRAEQTVMADLVAGGPF